MSLRLPGMNDEKPDAPAKLDRAELANTPDVEAMASMSVDMAGRSIDSGVGAEAPNAAAPLIRGAVVLGIILAVAGSGLFAMRTIGQRGLVESPDVEIDIEAIAERSEPGDADGHLVLLQDLRSAGDFRQVPLDAVQMNPFTLRAGSGTQAIAADPTPVPRETAEELAARQRAERLRELEREIGKLRLNSVMAGAVPLAQISGAVVRVGDRVSETFEIIRIEGRSVELEAEGHQFVLVMQD